MDFRPFRSTPAANAKLDALRLLTRLIVVDRRSPRPDEFLELVLAAANASCGALHWADDDRLVLAASAGLSASATAALSRLPAQQPPSFVADAAAREALLGGERAAWEHALTAPIQSSIVHGAVSIGAVEALDDDVAAFVESAAGLLAIAVGRDEQLKRLEPRSSRPPAPKSSARETAVTVKAVAPRRILWIDPDFDLLERVERAFHGTSTRTASSADEAETILDAGWEPAFVFCDVSLPDRAGLALLESVATARPRLRSRFVFTSSGMTSPQLAEALAQSRVPTLTKPLDLELVAGLAREAPPNVTAAALFGSRRETASDRDRQLTMLAKSLATAIRARGPMRGGAAVELLRERGIDHSEALAVVTVGISSGLLNRRAGVLAATPARSERILVVDDDADLRDSIGGVLVDAGYSVETASSGFEALSSIRAEPPSLVVLDLMMPEISGWRVLDVVRNDAALASTPIVVVSAADRASLASLPPGTPILGKPVHLQALLDTVTRLRSSANCG